MVDTTDNGMQKARILDIKTIVMLGTMLVTMTAAWTSMSQKVDRLNVDLGEVKAGYASADTLLRAQINATGTDISDVKASLAGMQRDLFYIRQALERAQP